METSVAGDEDKLKPNLWDLRPYGGHNADDVAAVSNRHGQLRRHNYFIYFAARHMLPPSGGLSETEIHESY